MFKPESPSGTDTIYSNCNPYTPCEHLTLDSYIGSEVYKWSTWFRQLETPLEIYSTNTPVCERTCHPSRTEGVDNSTGIAQLLTLPKFMGKTGCLVCYASYFFLLLLLSKESINFYFVLYFCQKMTISYHYHDNLLIHKFE